jgi:hypothetical protein
MAGKKASLGFEDYVRGIKGLKPEEQLSLVEIISASVSFLLIPHISLAKSLISVDRDGLHVSSQTF